MCLHLSLNLLDQAGFLASFVYLAQQCRPNLRYRRITDSFSK